MNKAADITQKALKMARLAKDLEISLALEGAYPETKGKAKTLKFTSQSPHRAREHFTMTLDGKRYPATSIPDIVWEDFKQIQKNKYGKIIDSSAPRPQ